MEAAKKKLLDRLGKKGFDTEKKVNSIDMQVAVDNEFTTDELRSILELQKAIKNHSVYSFIMSGRDAGPAKKEVRHADDDRSPGAGISSQAYED